MPVITVYGVLEEIIPQTRLLDFAEAMRKKVCQIEALKLDIDQVSILFPKDCLSTGTGEELIIFVDGLFDKPERTKEVRSELASGLVETTYEHFRFLDHFSIECFIRPFDKEWGFASGGTMDVG